MALIAGLIVNHEKVASSKNTERTAFKAKLQNHAQFLTKMTKMSLKKNHTL